MSRGLGDVYKRQAQEAAEAAGLEEEFQSPEETAPETPSPDPQPDPIPETDSES